MGKNKGGRPTKYRKRYCRVYVKIMKAEGFVETFCAKVGVGCDTFYRWKNKFPEFSKAVKKGDAISKKLFKARMHKAAWDSKKYKVNNGIIALLAYNCHGMSSKPKEEEKEKGVDKATLLKELASILPD